MSNLPLRLNAQEFSPFVLKGKTDDIRYLKPIKALMVYQNEQGHMEFIALTAAGQEYFAAKMDYQTQKPYALIASDGRVLACTPTWSLRQKEQVIHDKQCQPILAFVQFLNGSIPNPFHFAKAIERLGWNHDTFIKALDAVKNSRIDETPMTFPDDFPVLEQLCGWKNHGLTIHVDLSNVPSSINIDIRPPQGKPWQQPVCIIEGAKSPAFGYFNGQQLSSTPSCQIIPYARQPNLQVIDALVDQLKALRKQEASGDKMGWLDTFSGTAKKAARIDGIIDVLTREPERYAFMDRETLLHEPIRTIRPGVVLGRLRAHDKYITIVDLAPELALAQRDNKLDQ